MSYEERGVWIYLGVAVVAFSAYVVVVLGLADGREVTEVPYVPVLLWVLGVSMLVNIAVRILVELARPGESGRRQDVRDRDIGRFGELVGGSVLSVAVLGVLVLVLMEVEHFWVANAIYVAFVAQAVSSSVVKVVAYRRGL